MNNETTTITTDFGDFVNCNDCGAFAKKGTPIKHYPSCAKGEFRRWEEAEKDKNMGGAW